MNNRNKKKTPSSSSKTKKEHDVRVINLESHVRPAIIENQWNQNEWVEYGADNNYFTYVTDRYYGSPTNNALINSIVDMVYGGGLMIEGGSEADQERLNEIFRPDEVKKMAFDFYHQGNFAFEVIKNRGGDIAEINHMPIETLRPNKANSEAEIERYWFSANWAKYKGHDQRFKPIPIPAWGFDKSEGKQIFYVRRYSPGNFYFSPPQYQGALPYAEIEEEIANYHINNIKNAFAPSAIINYNNGVPDKNTRDVIERKTQEKFTTTNNAGRLLVAFNDSAENQVTMESFQLNDAHNQYAQLDEMARKNLLTGHRVVTPMLVGIKDSTGFGNNADELRTGFMLMDANVIRPIQNDMTDAFEEVLMSIGLDFKLFFENIQPLEVTGENQDPDEDESSAEAIEMHSHDHNFTDEEGAAWLEQLYEVGERMDSEEWEIYEEVEVDDPENEPLEFNFFDNPGAIVSNPQDRSKQDSGLFKVRYRYSTNISSKSRDFCKSMVSGSRAGIVFRREDITKMSRAGVNGSFAPEGRSTYSLWAWKGGAYCHHKWVRVVYRRMRDADGRVLPRSETPAMENDRKSTVGGAKAAGVPTDKIDPKGWKAASTAPINTPSKGSLKHK